MNSEILDTFIKQQFIKQIKNHSTQKIFFWGASLFLEELITQYDISEFNICGIIDSNPQKKGSKFHGLDIVSLDEISKSQDVFILFAVKSFAQKNYDTVKQVIEDMNNPGITLGPNLFVRAVENYNISRKTSNKIVMIDTWGNQYQNSYIEGLQVEWLGENSTIEIYAWPDVKFENVKIICGSNCKIQIGSGCIFIDMVMDLMADGSKLTIGNNCKFCGGNILMRDESDTEIVIGNRCLFSKEFYMRSSDGHVIYDNNTKEFLNVPKITAIGDHVWCGKGVSVLKNSKISDDTVVGISSVVNKVFEENNVIIAGVPAKVVKTDINWDMKHAGRFEGNFYE